MKIVVNGKEQSYNESKLQLLELIKLNKVQQPDMVSVQLNGEFVQRDNFTSTELTEGDEVDFLYFMGGGQR
ncbi:MAG: sulfur carrier protein ThiS [Bacteroidota bacterium]|nr:sulfur carrier protein ThiS [Bacteroidota bacterium]